MCCFFFRCFFFFFQAEDGIRDLVRSRGLGDVYKRQHVTPAVLVLVAPAFARLQLISPTPEAQRQGKSLAWNCLLYTSDAADERSSVDLGGRRIIKKKHDAINTT